MSVNVHRCYTIQYITVLIIHLKHPSTVTPYRTQSNAIAVLQQVNLKIKYDFSPKKKESFPSKLSINLV